LYGVFARGVKGRDILVVEKQETKAGGVIGNKASS